MIYGYSNKKSRFFSEKENAGGIFLLKGLLISYNINIKMDDLSAYTIDGKLYEDANASVYSGTRKKDGKKVIINISLQSSQYPPEIKTNESRFLANMSHEIRTPLNGVLGFANLMLYRERDEVSRNYLQKIIHSGKGLLQLLNDILEFSRLEAGEMEIYPHLFDIEQLLDDLKALFQLQYDEKGVTLAFFKGFNIPLRAFNDRWRIQQVLSNLLANALTFTREGGVRLELEYEAPSDMLRFAVIDTGCGISDEEIESIFQPFRRLERGEEERRRGAGLGLNICLKLLKLLGGQLAVVSKPGRGSTFTAWVPVNSDKLRENPPPLSQELPGKAESLESDGLVLMVEDNIVNRELLRAQLESRGFNKIMEAQNGGDGVRMCLEYEPVIVFMDIHMPLMDGNVAIREIRAGGYTGVIVAVSAYAMLEDKKKSIEAGADEYITKPIDFDVFFPTLVRLMKGKTKAAPDEEENRAEASMREREGEKSAAEQVPDLNPAHASFSSCNKISDAVSDRVKSVFLSDAAEKVEVLKKALNDDESWQRYAGKVAVIAHEYKGNAMYMGLKELAQLAVKINRGIKSARPPEEIQLMTSQLVGLLEDVLRENGT